MSAAPTRDPRPLRLAAGLLATVMLGSVVAGIVFGRPWELRQPPELTRVTLGDSGRSIDVPAPIAAKPVTENAGDGTISYLFGSSGHAPMTIEVRLVRPPAPMTAADYEDARKSLQESKTLTLPDGEWLGPAKLQTAGERTWVACHASERRHGVLVDRLGLPALLCPEIRRQTQTDHNRREAQAT